MIPLIIHRNDRQVVAHLILGRVTVEARASGNVRFNAKDRLDARCLGRLVIVEHPTHRPVVGNGCCRHSILLNSTDKVANFRQAIK